MSMYRRTTVDFIQRTKANLELINGLTTKTEGQAYEVTQLVNSLLGLLVMPQQQRVLERDVELLSLSRDGWPFPQPADGFRNPRYLTELLRLMRNSIAHWGLEFGEANGKIANLKMTNKHILNANPSWVALISISDLNIFVQKLCEHILRELDAG